MKIAAVCVTYNRPELLGRMIRCFELQDYPDRELVVLDDAGQYGNHEGDRWRLISIRSRFSSLGAKRNAAANLLDDDVDAVAVWDDDDLYLPRALSASVAALSRGKWAQPRQVLEELQPKQFTRVETFDRRRPDEIAYHGGWSFRREVVQAIRYPPTSNGEDRELATSIADRFGPSVDTLSPKHPEPFYVYNHQGGRHLSCMGPGNDGYQKLAGQHIQHVRAIDVTWKEDYLRWPISETVRRRRW